MSKPKPYHRPYLYRGTVQPGVFQRCTVECPPEDEECRRHTWTYTVELPARNGKRRQVTKGGHETGKQAKHERDELRRKHREGILTDDGRLTVGSWLDRWLRDRERDPDSPLRPTTALGYRQHIETYWKPKIGHVRLRDLRRDIISSALAEIVAERDAEIAEAERRNAAWFAKNPNGATRPYRVPKPFSRSTLTRFRAALSSALGDAVDAGLIATNPALNVRLRKGKKRHTADAAPVKAWSAADAGRFLDAVSGERHPMVVLFHVALVHGLRRGELCGLVWSSVDLDAGTLTVERTRTTAGYTIVEGDPKSEHSRAIVALDQATVELLRVHRVRQAEQRLMLGEAWAAGDLVFTREDGAPWHPDRVTKMFAAAVRRHGLPEITLHGLRHTSASVQIDAGVPIEIVSKRLRHGHVTITSQVYSHLVGDAGKQAAEAVADAVSRHRKDGARP